MSAESSACLVLGGGAGMILCAPPASPPPATWRARSTSRSPSWLTGWPRRRADVTIVAYGAMRSTLDELTQITLAADKVLTF